MGEKYTHDPLARLLAASSLSEVVPGCASPPAAAKSARVFGLKARCRSILGSDCGSPWWNHFCRWS